MKDFLAHLTRDEIQRRAFYVLVDVAIGVAAALLYTIFIAVS